MKINTNKEFLNDTLFLVLGFPLATHYYLETFSIIYLNNLYLGVGLLFLGYSFLGFNLTIYKETKALGLCLASIFISGLFIPENLIFSFKSAIYLIMYNFIFRPYFKKKHLFIFLDIFTIITAISIGLYILSLCTDFHYDHYVLDMREWLFESSILTRALHRGFEFSFPYYLVNIPMNMDAVSQNILGLPRFHGLGTEPSHFAVITCLCASFSLFVKKRFHAVILFISVLMTHSLWSFITLTTSLVFIIIGIFSKKRNSSVEFKVIMFTLFLLFFLLIFYFFLLQTSYFNKFLGTILFTKIQLLNISPINIRLPGIIDLIFSKGLIPTLLYLIFIRTLYTTYIKNEDYKIKTLFYILVLTVQKKMLLSPLFFVFLAFLLNYEKKKEISTAYHDLSNTQLTKGSK